MNYFLIYLFAINVITALLFIIDKKKSVTNSFRTPERVLIISVLLGGFIGGFISIYKVRHKNKKASFMFPVSVAAIISMTVMYILVFKTNILM